MDKVYIITFEERMAGFEEFSYLAVKGADKKTSQELVEEMWFEIDSVDDFDGHYKDNPYYWVAGNEKLVRVVSKKPISSNHLEIVNQYITV
jgi:hypothetical protein|tara:strand:+ start:724 stop:996 length:273 start_codon:yes stop_codon:yes gene_type:complete